MPILTLGKESQPGKPGPMPLFGCCFGALSGLFPLSFWRISNLRAPDFSRRIGACRRKFEPDPGGWREGTGRTKGAFSETLVLGPGLVLLRMTEVYCLF